MVITVAIAVMATAVVASPVQVNAEDGSATENVSAMENNAQPPKTRNNLCGGKPCDGRCILLWCVHK
ncbi:hypothetical protein EC968_003943 [Mortierella alpina]|nr:hypothetical protein EC968_003943 [Mortierella alpina]